MELGSTGPKGQTVRVDHNYWKTAEAYFDIRIYGGTWGKLTLGEDSIPMQLQSQEEQDYLTFPDITLHNPLFRRVWGDEINIETDGTAISSYKIMLKTQARAKLIVNPWSVTWFDSLGKVLLLGHAWQLSHIVNYADLKIETRGFKNGFDLLSQ
jgi:hypothetical protein